MLKSCSCRLHSCPTEVSASVLWFERENAILSWVWFGFFSGLQARLKCLSQCLANFRSRKLGDLSVLMCHGNTSLEQDRWLLFQGSSLMPVWWCSHHRVSSICWQETILDISALPHLTSEKYLFKYLLLHPNGLPGCFQPWCKGAIRLPSVFYTITCFKNDNSAREEVMHWKNHLNVARFQI